ncbi:OmpA family protein [Zhouia amylolytica]|uniref:Outer membrane protein, peptidoglycan-associated lipoprotein n=1 Tax=Zhouia amylolytica AD3 TaxID=1286632 RepID=W2UQZ7_9FLAO|nr:OmpA family protein [Zhouia amylolytica]ETN96443.1 outer membrane protein, peptidoglycan-associated lipoprotein [Zhouia amylolytica AD3]
MMKLRLLIICFLTSISFYGQKKFVADKYFNDLSYVKAAELYEEVVRDGDSTPETLYKLADCYYNNSESEKAAKWYEVALKEDKKYDKKPEYVYKYIQTQRSTGNYENANDWLKIFNDITENDSRTQQLQGNLANYFKDYAKTEGVYVRTQNLPINTADYDFGAYAVGDKLYYSSGQPNGKTYGWNGQPFLDIYQADVNSNGDAITVTGIEELKAKKVNTPYHEANIAISQDGQTLYFTRNNVSKNNRLKSDHRGVSHLKLYKASLVDGIWQNIEELPFNGSQYSVGHPALSPDGKTLFFVSDKKGGFGQTDIYAVSINEDGSFGKPENLGKHINTEGKEMFPFVAKDSTFYFSSDGYLGLGLLDIYKSDIIHDNSAAAENMGAPYNSQFDDFAFFMNNDLKTGYLSSNRPGGKGGDDIYYYEAFNCTQLVEGIVRDASTQLPLEAEVSVYDSTGKLLTKVNSNAEGLYSLRLDCDKQFKIKGTKPDYRDTLLEISTTKENDMVIKADLDLIPLIDKDQIVLNPIFFNFDKWDIRTDAQYELEHIVNVMKNHPQMVIKIESHTDSRGSKRYNMKLSQRRADSTKEYLLSRGIEQERIESSKGYGESQLLNECADGVRCSEAKHQENRRSYFYIVKYY